MNRQGTTRAWLSPALGTAGIIFVTAFWAITGRIEPSLVALFGSMVGVSEGVGAIRDLQATKDGKPPS